MSYQQPMFTVTYDVAANTLRAFDPSDRELAAVQLADPTTPAEDGGVSAYVELARLAATKLAEWYS